MGTSNGSYALLQCDIEAFPRPITYWVYGDNKIIHEGYWKYKTSFEEKHDYKFKFTLNITYVEPTDYGKYKCVAKNERGTTAGQFILYGNLELQ